MGIAAPTLKHVSELCETLMREHEVRIFLGVELEFYTDVDRIDALAGAIQPALLEHGITLAEWKAEDGKGQWECAIEHAPLETALQNFLTLHSLLSEVGNANNIAINMAAKPFFDQPSSGLHFHLHAENEQGQQLFTKQDDTMSKTMAYCLAGLLRMMPASMVYFAPDASDYARYREGEHVPAHVCWGMNNRSAAIRIPEKKGVHKHIEHRVSSANTCPIRAVWAILVGLHVGLTYRLDAPPPIFGMARDAQYDVPLLPHSLSEAERAFWADEWMQGYVSMLT